ncbi:MAG: methyltransferase domain-containing protein [Caldilineaceae bacterium]|nr:methyltransferase domain-containing protein [Caldilineaceae bacterium]
MKFLVNSLAAGAGTVIGTQVSLRVGQQRTPHPMPHQFASLLDHGLRLRYRDPLETLGLFGIAPGMTVLDLGCGTGLFTTAMARMVGPTGTVHAVDVQQPMLDATAARLAEADLAQNVRLHHAGAYALPLPDASCDLAVVVATLGEIPDRYAAMLELRRVLKPGARLAVSEELPDPGYLSGRAVRTSAEEAGFRLKGKTGSFFCYHMVFVNSFATDDVVTGAVGF